MTGDDFPGRCTDASEIPDGLKGMYQDRLSDVFAECDENELVCFASSGDVTHDEERELVREAL